MKILKTQKLFYGKWPYKVSVNIRGAHLIRFYGAEVLIRRFDDPNDSFKYHSFKTHELEELGKCARSMCKLESVPNIKYRYEHNTISIFTDTRDVFEKIRGLFFSKIIEVWEPSNEIEIHHLKNNVNHVIVDTLPHKKYKYKAVLRYGVPHLIRQAVIKWLDDNKNTTRITKSTCRYLQAISYTQTPFIYVEDEKTLMMLQLIAGEQIKKTEKYIIRTDINNTK